MGSSCSSGQKHKDNASTRSQDSPTYQGGPGVGAHGANHHAPAAASAAPQGAAQAGGGTQPASKPVAAAPAAPAKTEPERGVVTSVTSESVADDGLDVLPAPLDKLPEELARLLLGKAAASANRPAARTNKIAIYVCAADAEDCCVEKGALHRHVYPELRAACRERGYELHIVDLHWRTPLERRQDHEFPELCLGELARQQETAYVVPVLFLSTSLGRPLLPNTVESQDFEKALAKAEDKSLLTKWYSLDTHAQPPCYRLSPPTRYIPGLKGDSEAALSEWRGEVERTLAVLQAVLPTELRDTYLSTAVEQEVHNTVCMSQEMARRTLWLHRVYTHQPPADPAAPAPTPQEAELRRRLDAIHQLLKAQLVEKHILRMSVKYCDGGLPPPEQPEHAQYVADVTAQLTSTLRNILDAIIDEDQARTVGRPGFGLDNRLVLELGHQAGVCQRASQCSVNRDAVIAQVKSYVEGKCRAPLVITGPRGCGKSTLLARVAQSSASWTCSAAAGCSPGPPLLAARFCGVSADSMTLERVLASIGQQCRLLWDAGHTWASHTVDSWREQLPELLAGAASKRTLVVMVDGLDLLKNYGIVSGDWLPAELPDNAKLIVTLWDGSAMLPALRARLPANAFISMPKLDQTEAAGVLNAWVMQYNHSVPKRVQDCVLASDCTLPLYAKVLAWQTSLDQSVAPTPRGNVDDQVRLLLDQLEEALGEQQVAHAAALISAAKYGVSDSEMLDLLAHDATFHSTETHVAWAPACLFWARFNKLLAPFLHWVLCDGELVLQWRDAAVRDAVDARYKAKEGAAAAKALLNYFQGSWWAERAPQLQGRLQPMSNLTDKCYNARKLQELPFQAHAVKGSIKKEYLLDLGWVYDKVCGTDVFQVLEDIALERSSDADVQWLADTLREAAPALAFDGRQLHSQLFRRLTQDFPSTSPPPPTAPGSPPAAPEPGEWVSVPAGRALPREALAACTAPPAPALLPIPTKVPDDGPGDVPDRLDLIVRIRDFPDYVVTVSTAKEEIAVWDVLLGERVRLLRGVPQPLNLQPVDATRCIVLCQRELRIYDLDACTLLAKLKGVMNQKMPYFGLHDQSHLVALSRNRMYVNLMNLDSGDCVTTFKAGEDRFLNSLLVSGDGRVLVCGDETQKPFPLLVWNLASRKLLYDLRIPHHDFVTSLAAITHEGHYVCCVAQEVDEPSANFIVVYDLQSGTLFKKWKPGVNTVSLNISSRGGCVISGLQDGRVLVWDLITGNCRWTLSGHTAPVDYLRLDAQGGTFLSADSKCRDRSLRLWDLNKGTLVAVYTARRPVTACEVTHGGEVLVLAEEGAGHPTTLRLRGRAATTPPGQAGPGHGLGQGPGAGANPAQAAQPSRYFGQPQNHGRIVDFR